MLKINEGDYAYAAARIRAIEIKLFDKSRYDRMLEAPSADEAFKMLSEAEYGFGSGNADNVYSFEALLVEEMKKCYSLLYEIAPQVELIKAFQRRHDFFNLKVLLKAEFSCQEAPNILMDIGTIEKENLKRIVTERKFSELSTVMRKSVEEIYDVFSKTQDPQMVDLLLDKASYHQLIIDLKAIQSPFLHRLAETMVDVTNIKMFIRARLINKAWDFIQKLILDGGIISGKVFLENSDKSIDSFIDDVHFTQYGDVVYNGWELFRTKKNISGLERLLDDYLMKFISEAKMVLMGVEPLVAYLFAKETEIRNVRIIMTGKINRLPADLIRERLRLGYV